MQFNVTTLSGNRYTVLAYQLGNKKAEKSSFKKTLVKRREELSRLIR